eukprot:scaffold110946_cov61-Attheya_sp.AAC.1
MEPPMRGVHGHWWWTTGKICKCHGLEQTSLGRHTIIPPKHFGVVDPSHSDKPGDNETEPKDRLYSHVYDEGLGNNKKGGSNVTSLIMKTLYHLGWMQDGNPGYELNIAFDNCPGQNKNNCVLRLVPYLIEMGWFLNVNFMFLVVGHTKNAAERMFNRMKKTYRLQSEAIHVLPVKEGDMKDWTTFLSNFYRKLPEIDKMHIFSCKRDYVTEKAMNMVLSEADVPDTRKVEFNSIK